MRLPPGIEPRPFFGQEVDAKMRGKRIPFTPVESAGSDFSLGISSVFDASADLADLESHRPSAGERHRVRAVNVGLALVFFAFEAQLRRLRHA